MLSITRLENKNVISFFLSALHYYKIRIDKQNILVKRIMKKYYTHALNIVKAKKLIHTKVSME